MLSLRAITGGPRALYILGVSWGMLRYVNMLFRDFGAGSPFDSNSEHADAEVDAFASFSTAVLRTLREHPKLTNEEDGQFILQTSRS